MPRVIDATHRSDNRRVSIKATRNDTQEIHIARFLSEQQSSENHCVSVLDVLQDNLEPHTALLIMPYLRPFNDPEFLSIGEVMEFIQQTLEVQALCARTLGRTYLVPRD